MIPRSWGWLWHTASPCTSVALILKLAFSTSQTEGGPVNTALFPNSPIKVMWNTACFGSHTPLQSISMLSISSLHTLCAYRVIHCTRAHTYAIPLRSKVVKFQWQKGRGLITVCTKGSWDAWLHNLVAETATVCSSGKDYQVSFNLGDGKRTLAGTWSRVSFYIYSIILNGKHHLHI